MTFGEVFEGQGYALRNVRRGGRSGARSTRILRGGGLETAVLKIRDIQSRARGWKACRNEPTCWPLPSSCAHLKGWTGPKIRRWRAHRGHVPRAPGAGRRMVKTNPEHLAILEDWMRSYRPEELFDEAGRFRSPSTPIWRRPGRGAWDQQPPRQWRPADGSPLEPARLRRLPGSLRQSVAAERTGSTASRAGDLPARYL